MTHTQAVNTLAAERYLLDEMSELERHAFEHHYFACRECADDVRAGAMMREGVRSGMNAAASAQPAPSSVERFGQPRAITEIRRKDVRAWRPSVVLPWAVAATLAVAVVYQSSSLAPQMSLQPHALDPITLRPASRGADATVTRGSSPVVTFALDVNVPSGSELAFDLQAADGTTLASGRLPAPVQGQPLFLLVPSSTLGAAGRYLIVVRHGSTNERVGEYRFAVVAK